MACSYMLFQEGTRRKFFLVVCGHPITKIVVKFISCRLLLHPRMCLISCQPVDLSSCRKTFLQKPHLGCRLKTAFCLLSSSLPPLLAIRLVSYKNSRALLARFESVIKAGSEGPHGQQTLHTRVNLI